MKFFPKRSVNAVMILFLTIIAATAIIAYLMHTRGGQAPRITKISPSTVHVGDKIILLGSGFSDAGNIILFDGWVAYSNISSNGSEIDFDVSRSVSPRCKLNDPCPNMAELLSPGDYKISVANRQNQISNEVPVVIQ